MQGDVLVLSDLRMGLEPAYSFNFAVAQRRGGAWQPMPPTQVPAGEGAVFSREGMGAAWRQLWRRMWHEPQAPD